MREVNLSGSRCQGAVFRDVDFTNASLREADFTGADLRGTTLTAFDPRDVTLRDAIITADQAVDLAVCLRMSIRAT
ncbi:pentapeptide repeat-containing protein [Phytohabitans kaempferiae]|uniref:Pentapeptide repeat-containing protein n=1 Tax=Phytohabitans kaempferiae TaxID=1620943 RepID=A0ABV6LW38_9ACTN